MTASQFMYWLADNVQYVTASQFDLWYHIADNINAILDVHERSNEWMKVWPTLKKEMDRISNSRDKIYADGDLLLESNGVKYYGRKE